MINKKTLSLKLNKSFQAPPDAPFTPVEQTLQTPVNAPNHNSYFGFSSSGPHHESSSFSQPADVDSDDVMTDVDEPSSAPKVLRNYSVNFTPGFDQILMDIYSHILSLPTTTPFSGSIPPSGLASRVANETLHKISSDSDPSRGHEQTVYDTQGMLSHEQLKNNSTTHIVLQLIRKRLLDICASQKSAQNKGVAGTNMGQTSVQVAVAAPAMSHSALGQNNSIYSGSGLRQSSISNLSLNDHNTANYQSQNQQNQGPPSLLASSRSRSSSLNLRKHSLTRNNSLTGSSWLHVGNLANVRANGNLGSNPEYSASTDSLQSMNDFVPHAFLSRQGSHSSTHGAMNGTATLSGFNPMMMDYQTPPSSAKSSVSHETYSPSVTPRETACFQLPESVGSNSDTETGGLSFSGTRFINRAGSNCSFPKPLTINTDMDQINQNNPQSFGFGGMDVEALHSPFVSAVSAPEDFEYFGQGNSSANVLENVSPNISGLRSGPIGLDGSFKEGSKVGIPAHFSLSEKKRDSLKLKRGIH